MLFLIAELYYTDDPRWGRRANALCQKLSRELSDLMRLAKRVVRDMKGLRAYYLDAETAVLEGKAHMVDRKSVLCRLCEATLPASDEVRLLHMRSTHQREWRKLTRL
jgi:hypothetical protein